MTMVKRNGGWKKTKAKKEKKARDKTSPSSASAPSFSSSSSSSSPSDVDWEADEFLPPYLRQRSAAQIAAADAPLFTPLLVLLLLAALYSATVLFGVLLSGPVVHYVASRNATDCPLTFPHGLATSSDGTVAYVASVGELEGAIVRLQLDAMSWSGEVPCRAVQHPEAYAMNALDVTRCDFDGRFYIAHDGIVSSMDADGGDWRAETVNAGGMPARVICDPDRGDLYSADATGASIVKYNGKSGRWFSISDDVPSAHGVFMDAADKAIYAVGSELGKVVRVTPARGRNTLPNGSRNVTNGFATELVVERAEFDQPSIVKRNAASGVLYVTDLNGIWTIDEATKDVVRAPGGRVRNPHDIAFLPSGDILAALFHSHAVVVIHYSWLMALLYPVRLAVGVPAVGAPLLGLALVVLWLARRNVQQSRAGGRKTKRE